MQVRVKLLGTLPSSYRGIYPPAGLMLDVPAETTIAEIVDTLGIPKKQVAIVTINGLLVKADDRAVENAVIKMMQHLAGG
jgi:sulfur carrier protein ThiS